MATNSANHFGYWNPSKAGGTDRLASDSFKLDAALFYIFPGWLAHAVAMVLQRVLAVLGCFLLLRQYLKLSPRATFAGAAAFSMYAIDGPISTGFALYHGFGLPLLPFWIWALLRLAKSARIRWALPAAFVLGALLAQLTHYAFAMFVLAGIGIWFALVRPPAPGGNRLWRWLLLASMSAGWLLADLPALWAGLANAASSHRIVDPESMLPAALSSAGKGLGNLYGAPLLVALVALWWSKNGSRRLLVSMLVATLAIALLPVVIAFSQTALGEQLGFLQTFNFRRINLLAPFFFAVLLAVALHAVEGLRDQRRSPPAGWTRHIILACMVVAFTAIAAKSLVDNARAVKGILSGENFSAMYAHPQLKELATLTAHEPPFRVGTVMSEARILPDFTRTYGFESAGGYVNLYSRRYHQFWGRVIAPVLSRHEEYARQFHTWGNIAYLYEFAGPHGFDFSVPFHSKQHRNFLEPTPIDGNYNLKLLSLANVRYVVSELPLIDHRLAEVRLTSGADLGGCDGWTTIESLKCLLRGDYAGYAPGFHFWKRLHVYRNSAVLPRAFLATAVELLKDGKQVLDVMSETKMSVLARTAFISKADVSTDAKRLLGAWQAHTSTSLARILNYSADRLQVGTDSSEATVLVVTNNFNAYWQASIDGVSVEVFAVDHAFIGVLVPAGPHQIRLDYRPPYAGFCAALGCALNGLQR